MFSNVFTALYTALPNQKAQKLLPPQTAKWLNTCLRKTPNRWPSRLQLKWRETTASITEFPEPNNVWMMMVFMEDILQLNHSLWQKIRRHNITLPTSTSGLMSQSLTHSVVMACHIYGLQSPKTLTPNTSYSWSDVAELTLWCGAPLTEVVSVVCIHW